MGHCDDEYTAFANAVIDEADAAVETDVAYEEYLACLAAHGGGSGGGSGSGSGGESMQITTIRQDRKKFGPRPHDRNTIAGYVKTRILSGDSKEKILRKLSKMGPTVN